MIAIICVDDNLGMFFNNRRQSHDKKLNEKILDISKGAKLWMNSYSYKMFQDNNCGNICVADNFLEQAGNGEYCFVEDKQLNPYKRFIEKIIVFKWNRSYPRDLLLDIHLNEWTLSESTEFNGNSHKKITMEVFVR